MSRDQEWLRSQGFEPRDLVPVDEAWQNHRRRPVAWANVFAMCVALLWPVGLVFLVSRL